MSQIKVDQITDEAGTGAPDFPNGLQVAGASLSGVADQVTAEAGLDNEALMTPLRTKEAIAALGGSMTLLGTLTTTSGTPQTLSGLNLTGYKFLFIMLNGVSHSQSGSTNLTLSFGGVAMVTVGGSELLKATLWCDLATGLAVLDKGTPAQGGVTAYSTATTSISFTFANSTFDAGSIRVYGVK